MREPVSLDSFHVVPPASHARASKIALLGCGTVGSAVARRLVAADASRTLELTHIVDRRADSKRLRPVAAERPATNACSRAKSPASIGRSVMSVSSAPVQVVRACSIGVYRHPEFGI